MLAVDHEGEINYNQLDEILGESEKKTLVSLMHVNNELGNILNVDTVIKMCEAHGALFHSDTVQGIGHVPLDLTKSPIHFITASAHKFHGPKGVGFAIIKKGFKIEPILHGGEQERGARAGTENTHSIIGMDKALTMAMEHFNQDKAYIAGLKQYFIEQIKARIKGIAFNGLSADMHKSAFHILNVRFPKQMPMLLFNLDLKGIAASGGSACQSGSNKGSHVLGAILDKEASNHTSVRFSFSKFNTKEEIDYTISEIEKLFTA
jgi:cysteine desulfurase